jgi:hypothetical protein
LSVAVAEAPPGDLCGIKPVVGWRDKIGKLIIEASRSEVNARRSDSGFTLRIKYGRRKRQAISGQNDIVHLLVNEHLEEKSIY